MPTISVQNAECGRLNLPLSGPERTQTVCPKCYSKVTLDIELCERAAGYLAEARKVESGQRVAEELFRQARSGGMTREEYLRRKNRLQHTLLLPHSVPDRLFTFEDTGCEKCHTFVRFNITVSLTLPVLKPLTSDEVAKLRLGEI